MDVLSTATFGVDFDLLTPSVTFPSGTTTPQTMTIRVYEDSFVESDETVIIDFSVNNNGGDAVPDTSANTHTLTITNDDSTPTVTTNVTLYAEDFDDGIYDVTTTGNTGSDLWQAGNSAAATSSYWNTTGNTTIFAFTNDDACNCDKANDRLTTTVIDLSGTYSSATLTFDHAFADVSETGTVRFSTNGTTFTTVSTLSNTSTPNGGGSYTTPWVNNNSINIPAPYLGSSTFYVQFLYNDGGAWSYGMAIDNIEVTAVTNTAIQTLVNTGNPDQIDINGMGSVYASDPISGNVMTDIINNNSFDYGCTDIAVNRAGTSGQSYNGSAAPDLVMDKTFEITPTTTTGTGNNTITFYFEEAEIAGWETSVAPTFDRNDLVIARGNATTITEIAPLTTIGAFGTEVTVSGNFTGLNGIFYFGPASAFVPPCVGVTKTWDGNNWSPVGIPDGTNPVILNGDYDTNIDGDLDACSLTINSAFTLTVESDNYVKVENGIVVDGSLIIEHEGNLVQVDPDAVVDNSGTINVNVTTPDLRKRDFMLLGSPMTGELRSGVYNSSFLVLDFHPDNFMPHPDVPVGGTNWADDNGDFYRQYSATINPGEGYIVRPQSGYNDPTVPPAGRPFNFTYELGTLNNGNITYTNYNNGPSNPNGTPNVVANPYACAIDADLFLTENPVGELYFWEHLTAPGTPLTGTNLRYDMNDISIYNGTMGIPAANDPGNILGTAPNGIIASTQGFGIRTVGAAGTTGTITFNNGMRLTSGNTTLRGANPISEKIILEVRENTYGYGGFTGIAFAGNASEGVDEGMDTNRLATTVSLYSHLDDGSEQLAIQTRGAFHNGIKIPLGFASQIDELLDYEISITSVEGNNLSGASVYLWDNDNKTLVKLNDGPYTFKSMAATFDERFVLLFSRDSFREMTLGTNQNSFEGIAVFPNPTEGLITIVSTNMEIEKVAVYDLQGREVQTTFEKGTSVRLDISQLKTSVYFAKIYTQNGTITKRIVKK